MIQLLSHLKILQLEQYSLRFYLKWVLKNPLFYQHSDKTLLVYTFKIKLFISLWFILYLFGALFFSWSSPLLAVIWLTINFLHPTLLLILSSLFIIPFGLYHQFQTIKNTKSIINSYPNLIKIGITGSFGKTSTKNLLFQILNNHDYTIKTPHSYNTLYGIAHVVNLELTKHLKYFVCEMAAYHTGEIKKLTQMVSPNYAILTGIGSQHLERFGSLVNTTQAKFELIDSLDPANCLVNLDNIYIQTQIQSTNRFKNLKTYSLIDPTADFFVKSHSFTPQGVEFTLVYQKKSFSFTSPLFGTSNLQNLTAAICMSLILNIPLATITNSVKNLAQTPNRLEIKHLHQATIIDNTYSSNVTGFTQLIADLKHIPGRKAILTPGIVELGSITKKTHLSLGKDIAKVFDYITLIGHSTRTSSLEKGIKSINPQAHITYLDNHHDYWATVDKLSLDYQWIVLENDLPENYL